MMHEPQNINLGANEMQAQFNEFELQDFANMRQEPTSY